MSYYADSPDDETVRVDWDGLLDGDREQEIPCARCYGSGLVEVQGQETDCIVCEGYGTVLI